jgi:hypothetical protein
MKIVNNYLNKNSIKAITIEESRESLIIMEKKSPEKTPEERQSKLMISEVAEGIQIKKEPTDNDDDELVKQEFLIPPDAIKQEPPESDDVDPNLNECINMEEALANQRVNEEILKDLPEKLSQHVENEEENAPVEKPPEDEHMDEDNTEEDKLDEILKINRQILSIIKNLDVKYHDDNSKNHSVLINNKCTIIKEADSLTSNRPTKSENNT